jgi:Tfp pilus assembly PilM family ATPase
MDSLLSALSPREGVIGLDVGDGLAVASRVRLDRRGRLHLKEVGWTAYNPKGTPADIAATIRKLWQRNKFSHFSVVSCLRSRALTLKRFQYPALSESELASALRLEAEETLQASQDDIVMDWHLNPTSPSESAADEAQNEGTLVVVPRANVDAHVSILEQAALLPVATDISCFAIANLFRASKPTAAQNHVVCLARLGTQSADIAVLYDEKAIYPRTVFVPTGHAQAPTKYFAESIKDVIAYYRFKLHLEDIEKVYLTGVVNEEAFALISTALDLPVELWDPLSEVHGMSRRVSAQLAAATPPERAGVSIAMGLALRGSF